MSSDNSSPQRCAPRCAEYARAFDRSVKDRLIDSSIRDLDRPLPQAVLTRKSHSLTYSNSKGLPLMPVAGGAIQLAILPTSVTGFIRLRTYSRSSIVGSHSDLRAANSSLLINFPSRSK